MITFSGINHAHAFHVVQVASTKVSSYVPYSLPTVGIVTLEGIIVLCFLALEVNYLYVCECTHRAIVVDCIYLPAKSSACFQNLQCRAGGLGPLGQSVYALMQFLQINMHICVD